MSSGIAISPEVRAVFDDLKKNRTHRYVILTIKDEKELVTESKAPRNATYSEFLDHMKGLRDECRYILYDYPTRYNDPGVSVDRLLLITWCPDTASVRNKMMFASMQNSVRNTFAGIFQTIQACDLDELSQKSIDDALVRR